VTVAAQCTAAEGETTPPPPPEGEQVPGQEPGLIRDGVGEHWGGGTAATAVRGGNGERRSSEVLSEEEGSPLFLFFSVSVSEK
jgi:hypothetical protein